MDLAPVAGVVTAALAAGAKFLPSGVGGTRRREAIVRDLDLYERLPEDSNARQIMLNHIERSIQRMTEEETTKRRDPTGIGLAVAFLIGGALFGYVGWTARSWEWTWWIASATFLLFGVVGATQDGTKAERDERGHRIDSKRQ